MKQLLLNIANLFKVKTIITLVCAGVFAYLAIKKILPTEVTVTIIVMVFEYYFHKDDKKDQGQG